MSDAFKTYLANKGKAIQSARVQAPKIDDKPINGKVYALTGPNSIASGNNWAESEVIEHDAPRLVVDFAEYRKQVDELVKHLDIPPADLAIVAVACLYRETFQKLVECLN